MFFYENGIKSFKPLCLVVVLEVLGLACYRVDRQALDDP